MVLFLTIRVAYHEYGLAWSQKSHSNSRCAHTPKTILECSCTTDIPNSLVLPKTKTPSRMRRCFCVRRPLNLLSLCGLLSNFLCRLLYYFLSCLLCNLLSYFLFCWHVFERKYYSLKFDRIILLSKSKCKRTFAYSSLSFIKKIAQEIFIKICG